MKRAPSLREQTQRNVEAINSLQKQADANRTLGERLADFVTAWVGSWSFLIVQSIVLVCWVVVNVLGWWHHWDPYPFILLNLVLSFQAAYATPVIMMSQNRQARLSDLRNQLDLQINLLSEQENTEQLHLLRLLCEKAGIPIEKGPSKKEKALEDETVPGEIIGQIESAIAEGKEVV